METMTKAYGAFVKNVIEPMLDRFSDILWLMEKKGIPITKESLSELAEKAFLAHVVTFVIDWLFKLVLCGVICFTVWKVL